MYSTCVSQLGRKTFGARLKSAVLATAALGILGGSALAADLPSRKGPPLAPVYVPPPFTWTGFYVGVNAGGGWANNNNRNNNLGFPFVGAVPFGGTVIPFASSGSSNRSASSAACRRAIITNSASARASWSAPRRISTGPTSTAIKITGCSSARSPCRNSPARCSRHRISPPQATATTTSISAPFACGPAMPSTASWSTRQAVSPMAASTTTTTSARLFSRPPRRLASFRPPEVTNVTGVPVKTVIGSRRHQPQLEHQDWLDGRWRRRICLHPELDRQGRISL